MWLGRVLLVISVAALAASPAFADEECRSERGNKLWAEGGLAYQSGDYPRAIEKLEAAYVECPIFDILFTLAQAHRQAGNTAQALALYRSWQRHPTPDPADKADVDKIVTDLEAQLETERANATKPPRGTRGTPRRAEGAWHRDMIGWALVATGVVGVGVGGWMLSHAEGLRDDAKSAMTEGDQIAFDDSADNYSLGGKVVIAVGGAVLVGGIIRLILHDRPTERDGSLEVACGPKWCGVMGRF